MKIFDLEAPADSGSSPHVAGTKRGLEALRRPQVLALDHNLTSHCVAFAALTQLFDVAVQTFLP